MRVILLKDVKGIGKANDIVDVKDGYGLNFLIPRGLAVKESKRSVEILDMQKSAKAQKDAEDKALAIEIGKKLETIVVEFTANAGKDGKMFGAISTKQVEEELKNKFGIEVDKRKIVSKINIDRLGYTTLDIELYKGVIGHIKVHVREKQ